MKKVLFTLFVAGLAFVSCSENPASTLESMAKENLTSAVKSIVGDSEDAKIENIKTVYSSDSLCILNFDLQGKMNIGLSNGNDFDMTFGAEYIYLLNNGKYYYASQLLSEDSVYVSKATLDKIKKGTIYESLSYDDALMYRAIMLINARGKEVGNNDAEVSIPNPLGTGLWELDSYNDEFGETTNDKYLRLTGFGKFSNSASTGEKLIVCLFADKDMINFRFIEYDESVVKEDALCKMKIKDAKGEVHNINFLCTEKGYINPFTGEPAEELRKIVEMEGVMSVNAEISDEYSSIGTYTFKLNLDGYKKALEYCK